jgi:twitching motility protein PilI
MANREALRELQIRLASRLQAARSGPVAVAWLAVKVAEVGYLFPLAQAGEIFPLVNIQHVPYCHPWFIGVTNLRGGLFGVVDLNSFMANGLQPGRTSRPMAQASVLTFNPALELNCALLLDDLAGLRKREAFAREVAPGSGSPLYFGSLFTDFDGFHWQEINLQQLSQFPEFLGISA